MQDKFHGVWQQAFFVGITRFFENGYFQLFAEYGTFLGFT